MRTTPKIRRQVIEEAAALGVVCGAPVKRHLCLRVPGHDGDHDGRGEKHVKSAEERLAWKLAKTRVRARVRQRQREHLIRQIHMRDRQIEKMQANLGYRIVYKIVGGRNRARRWRNQALWALSHRTLAGWRW